MNAQLVIVLALLVAAIVLFVIGRPRMDVVALLVLVALPLTGVLTVPETLSGFADPNVILIAALFVVGEGLTRTGVTYRIGDWLAANAGSSGARLLVLLMLAVALLGSVMSSTGVVAIFVPVALAVAKQLGTSSRQLLMPLSFAGLISGMLTLIATAPNLVVNAELVRHGLEPFGFFAPTPFGLVVLVLGVGYLLLMRGRLGGDAENSTAEGRRTIPDLLAAYGLDEGKERLRVLPGSELADQRLADSRLATRYGITVLNAERGPQWQRSVVAADAGLRLAVGDVITVTGALPPEATLRDLGLEEVGISTSKFTQISRRLGIAELLVPPNSAAAGARIGDLDLEGTYQVTVIGVRHKGRPGGELRPEQRLDVGDTLLVVGQWPAIQRVGGRASRFVLLDTPEEAAEAAPAGSRWLYAVLSLLVMVVLMVTGAVPNVLAALIACLLMGASGCIDMPTAYRAIHWPTLLLIVGMLPFAQALEKTGGIDLAAQGLLSAVGGAGPRVVLAAIFVATAAIGLFVSNTATAVLMAPVAIAVAPQLGASPYPFAMTVMLAASAAFMTPISSPVNTLVVEPGRYRFSDFVKIGTPFTLVVGLVSVLMVPLLLPL
ncbi:MAG: SLC13 family permease [Propionicimonas sp.]|uniref:SLC13 family permease n=1 Tax=Propionicimonas sp. TaxID=1955623 RepID=UPI003D0F9121